MKPLAIILVLVQLAATGCAIRTTDARGITTTFGLVWSSQAGPIPATREPEHRRFVFGRQTGSEPPVWVELRAAGLILENTPGTTGLTLGYKNSILVFPVEDAVTEVDRTQPGRPPRISVTQP